MGERRFVDRAQRKQYGSSSWFIFVASFCFSRVLFFAAYARGEVARRVRRISTCFDVFDFAADYHAPLELKP